MRVLYATRLIRNSTVNVNGYVCEYICTMCVWWQHDCFVTKFIYAHR